jgi:hypothetical protein
MHTMIIEDERINFVYGQAGLKFQGKLVAPKSPADLVDFLHVHHKPRDRATHNQLRKDFVQHIWLIFMFLKITVKYSSRG